jgi:hypothetical protein
VGKKRVSLKNCTRQAASSVGPGIDEGPYRGNAAKAMEEDISMKRYPGDLSISSFQELCNDQKDWPNVETKDQCGVQVTLYLPCLRLDRRFLIWEM